MRSVEAVNIVGSGLLDAEFDLSQLAEDIGNNARYEPEMYPGLYLRLDEDDPLTTIYRTGKFIVVGADSEVELYKTKQDVIEYLAEIMGETLTEIEFSIQNYVCTTDLGRELNLSALAVGLGLEHTEYEPEQFAGLLYTPEDEDCVVMIFRTGKVIITGGTTKESAERAVDHLENRLSELFEEV